MCVTRMVGSKIFGTAIARQKLMDQQTVRPITINSSPQTKPKYKYWGKRSLMLIILAVGCSGRQPDKMFIFIILLLNCEMSAKCILKCQPSGQRLGRQSPVSQVQDMKIKEKSSEMYKITLPLPALFSQNLPNLAETRQKPKIERHKKPRINK